MFTGLFYFPRKWSFNKSFLHFGITVTLVRQSKTANMAVSSGRHYTVVFIPLSVCVLSYMKAASNDERPLITVYPCRWCTAVSMWDAPVSFFFLYFELSPALHIAKKTQNTDHIRRGLTRTNLMKQAVNCEGIVATSCWLAVRFNGFPRKRW